MDRLRGAPTITGPTREAEIFRSIVDSCAPDHFRKSELPLLCSYCTAVNLSRWYAHEVNEGDGNYIGDTG